MRIRMLKPFRALKAGQELDQSDGVAEFWVQQGRAERMVPPVEVEVESKPRRTRRTQKTVA